MIIKIRFDCSQARDFISEAEIYALDPFIRAAHDMLHEKNGPGSSFTGWLTLPEDYDKEEFLRIKAAAEKIKKTSAALVVIGIGGSYLGSKMAIDMLGKNGGVKILFAGNNLSSACLSEVLKTVEDIDFSVNVISKSGTTTEPAIAFRLFRKLLIEKYGRKGARDRIFVTTDKTRGALRELSDREGYESFAIPSDIGGRYSVLTAVGLLPIAVSGADIDALMCGAYDAMREYENPDISKNDCYKYAAARNALRRKEKTIEILANFEPRAHFFAEWWKQLFGESEGKRGGGIFPASASFSADLHSLGQLIQDGARNIFETLLLFDSSGSDIVIEADSETADGLDFLNGKTIGFVNREAARGTLLAHTDGGVANLIVHIERPDEYCLGNLIYFFEKACAISGYISGINPFDQPGVEAYKNNMFALLGKPGYEDIKKDLIKRLQ